MLTNTTDAAKYFCVSSHGFHELCTSAQAGLSWSCSDLGFAVLDVVRERSCRAGVGGVGGTVASLATADRAKA